MNDQPTPQPRLQLFDWLRDPSLDVDLARPITYVAKIGPDGQPQCLFAQEVPYPSGDAMFVLGQQLRGHLERVPTTVAIAFGLSAKAVLVDSSGMVGVLPHDRRALRYQGAADGLPHLAASLVQLTERGCGGLQSPRLLSVGCSRPPRGPGFGPHNMVSGRYAIIITCLLRP